MGSGGGKSAQPQVVGYGYYVGFAYAFCGDSERILQIYRNEDSIWSGNITTGGLAYAKYGDKGDPHASWGSATGYGIAYCGDQTHADPYLGSKTDNVLAYAGTTYMSFPRPFIGDNVAAIPNLEAVVQRLTLNTPITNEVMGIDVNPIAAVYYMLVELMAVPSAQIDLGNFQEAADTCYSEGRGISMVISRSKSLIDWVNLVLNHADGVLVVDSFTGQYRVNMVRGGYDKNNLAEIYEEDCSKLKFTRKTWLDTYSSFIFKFTDASAGFKENSIEYRNSAAIKILGQDRAKDQSYPLFTSAASMQPAVDSYMRNNSYPLGAVKLTTNLLDFPNLNAGDVFKLFAPTLGIDGMVCRVGEIGGDAEGEINVDITATEDIFALTTNIPPMYNPPIGSGIDYEIGEFIYTDLKRTSRETNEYASMTPMFVKPTGYATTKLLTPDGIAHILEPWALGELVGDYTPTWQEGEITFNAPIQLTNLADLFTVNTDADAFARMQYAAWIGDESVSFGKLNLIDSENDLWEMDDIIHNIAGTPTDPTATIPAGTRVWITAVPARDIINIEIEPNETEAVTYYFQASNTKNTNTAFPTDFLYHGNADTPYPPSALQFHNAEVLWTPAYPMSGANYRSAANIVGGQDEGLAYGSEGYYEVFRVNSSGGIITKIADVNSGVDVLPYRFTHGLPAGNYVGVRTVGISGKNSKMIYRQV